jgi:hypothetical protein
MAALPNNSPTSIVGPASAVVRALRFTAPLLAVAKSCPDRMASSDAASYLEKQTI